MAGVVALLAVLAWPLPATASAHAARVGAEPAADAVLDAGPTRVRATFNEALQREFASMTVVGPDGNLWSAGDAEVTGAAISVGVRPLGPAGPYTVNYRVTSADGHVVSGSWTFHLRVAGTGEPGPSAAAPDVGTGLPAWPWLLGIPAVVLAAGGLAGLGWVRLRRRGR
ncbi:copper resistance protein CopC [Mycobacterium sp. MYCO198283]|nr:copper resistance CopC family protein [Mycobacterium sp. MYCO198283]MCG5433020.1 copper resistance protein CopC [Mycobacterium sp. MYCO198283]